MLEIKICNSSETLKSLKDYTTNIVKIKTIDFQF